MLKKEIFQLIKLFSQEERLPAWLAGIIVLKASAEKILGVYQVGFRQNRSTTDQVFLLKQNLEKCCEYNKLVHILFIDFKQAFDSLKRHMIPIALRELGIRPKIIKLVMQTLRRTFGKVLVQNHFSEPFEINSGEKARRFSINNYF